MKAALLLVDALRLFYHVISLMVTHFLLIEELKEALDLREISVEFTNSLPHSQRGPITCGMISCFLFYLCSFHCLSFSFSFS